MPGIVICRHGDEGVGDFGFAEEFCFGHGGHVDDGDGGFGREGAVENGFGAGGELWSLYISQELASVLPVYVRSLEGGW